MSFYSCLVFGITSICLGALAGCLICVISAKIANKKYLRSRFAVSCVLLSVAVAMCAGGFVLISDMAAQMQFVFQNIVYFAALFALGLLCSVFWRSVLPLCVLVYILASAFTGFKLYSLYGSKADSITVTVTRNSIQLERDDCPVDDCKNKSIVVEARVLPAQFLFPLPRVWYSPIGVIDSEAQVDGGENLRFNHAFSGPESAVSQSEGENKGFVEKVLGPRKNLLIKIPPQDAVPSIYTLNFKTRGEVLTCSLNKDL